MNLKNVLRTYVLLRNLTDDESALLETLRGLSEGEREQLVESLSPVKVVGKKRKPRTTTKSSRAASLAEQIKSTGKASGDKEVICNTCGNYEDFVDHFKPSPHYHPFTPPSSAASAARKSSANSAESSSTANSEDEMESAAAVAGGSSD